MSQNPYGSGGRHTPRNPTERGIAVPSVPGSHAATVSPGSTAIPKSDPQGLADRIRGGPDSAQGGPGGANRRAKWFSTLD
jgi:hypothetical protein